MRRCPAASAALVAVMLAAAVSACAGAGHRPAAVASPPPPAVAVAPQPTGGRGAGVAGAERAATGFAQLAPVLLSAGSDDAAVLQALAAVVAEGGGGHVMDETARALARLHQGAPGPVKVWLAPLAVQAGMVGDQATVELWCARVTELAGQPAAADWLTQTWRLADQGGAWRVQDEAESAGPQPGAGLDGLLSGFHPVGASDGR